MNEKSSITRNTLTVVDIKIKKPESPQVKCFHNGKNPYCDLLHYKYRKNN